VSGVRVSGGSTATYQLGGGKRNGGG